MKLTVPTWLTLLRIVLIPVLVLVFYLPYSWTNFAAAFIFVLAAVTDWLDGWIARRYHLYSAFGAFLDPVADKLMVAVSLFLIVQDTPTMWMAIWAAVIVGREIAVSALREWMAELGQRATVKVAALGKIKTIVQMVALSCLLTIRSAPGQPSLTPGAAGMGKLGPRLLRTPTQYPFEEQMSLPSARARGRSSRCHQLAQR